MKTSPFGEDIIPTSDATNKYNCISWSVGIDSTWIWPSDGCAWPADLVREETVENFKNFYELFGFKECASAECEDSFEKVALYCSKNSVPLHAARSLKEKIWTSKLGPKLDVSHLKLESLDHLEYGKAMHFFKRPWGLKIQLPELHDPKKKKFLMYWENG